MDQHRLLRLDARLVWRRGHADRQQPLTQGGPRNSSKTVVYYLYQQGFGSSNPDISYACTIGLVLFLIIFTLSLLNLKLSQNNVNLP